MTQLAESTAHSPQTHSARSLYAALGGTFFLRAGGGVMGILTGLFLAAKNFGLGENHPFHISATLAGLVIASFFISPLLRSFISMRVKQLLHPLPPIILRP